MFKKLLLAALVALTASFNVQASDSSLSQMQGYCFAAGSFLASAGLACSLKQLHADKGEFNKSTAIGTGLCIAALAYFGAFTFYAYKTSGIGNEKIREILMQKK